MGLFAKGELSLFNKVSCFFRLETENVSKGALVQCAKRFFLAFDASKTVHHTRKFLFEGHLLLAHKDYRICHMDENISPMNVSDGITLQ